MKRVNNLKAERLFWTLSGHYFHLKPYRPIPEQHNFQPVADGILAEVWGGGQYGSEWLFDPGACGRGGL